MFIPDTMSFGGNPSSKIGRLYLAVYYLFIDTRFFIDCQGRGLVKGIKNARCISISFLEGYFLLSIQPLQIAIHGLFTFLPLQATGRLAEAPPSPAQSKRPRKLKASDL